MFETLRAYQGEVFALDLHLERLSASAHTLGWTLPQLLTTLRREIRRMARRFPHTDAAIRVMVLPQQARAPRPEVVVMGRALHPYPRRWYTDGVTVMTTVGHRYSVPTITPQAKHTDLVPGILAWSQRPDAAVELIYRTTDGWVGEGTISNVCLITHERELWSAPPATGVLAGVTCHILCHVAPEVGLTTRWEPFTRHQVWQAAEVFVANTTFEVLPVVRYDGRVIGAGRPGAWTQQLHAAFRRHVRTEQSA